MAKEVMSFNKFKKIMTTIQDFIAQRDRINDFFEEEIMKDSFCLITLGLSVEDMLINMLADEFDCWYSLREGVNFNWWEGNGGLGAENEICNWLYELRLDESKPRTVEVNGKEVKIDTLEELYTYLASEYYRKQAKAGNLT